MKRIKEFKYFTLVMLLCSFIAAGSLISCRETQKKENTEQQSDVQEEHPEGESEEHPSEEGSIQEEEHPQNEGEEHPE